MRNLYPNFMKKVLNSIIEDQENGKFRRKIERIRKKVEREHDVFPIDLPFFLKFCEKQRSKQKFSLKEIHALMNPELDTGREQTCKLMCQEYVLWYLEKQFPLHVITSDQCESK